MKTINSNHLRVINGGAEEKNNNSDISSRISLTPGAGREQPAIRIGTPTPITNRVSIEPALTISPRGVIGGDVRVVVTLD